MIVYDAKGLASMSFSLPKFKKKRLFFPPYENIYVRAIGIPWGFLPHSLWVVMKRNLPGILQAGLESAGALQ